MFCPKCGTKVEGNSKYCPSCGEMLPPQTKMRNRPAVTDTGRALSVAGPHISRTGSFLIGNRYRMIVIIMMAFTVVSFIYALAGTLKLSLSELSGLERLEAGLGAAAYMAFMIIPCLLSLESIRAALMKPVKTGIRSFNIRMDAVDKSVYLPAALTMVICILMLVFPAISAAGKQSAVGAALSVILGSCKTAATAGLLLCAGSIAITVFSRKRTKSLKSEI